VFAAQPEKLERFVEIGALCQVTASSITGAFGRAAQVAADEFFQRGLLHVVASDSHSVERRPPSMSKAREVVLQRWGRDAESILFDSTPAAIVGNEVMA
jgi:protein-tyrosine phosphatase